MALDYGQLKTEILITDQVLKARVLAGDHQGVADSLNAIRAGVTIRRDVIDSYELFECIVQSDYAGLSATDRQLLQTILSMGRVNLKGDRTRQTLALLFGAATTTRANIIALVDRQGSRAEQLFGGGVRISAADIAKALLA